MATERPAGEATTVPPDVEAVLRERAAALAKPVEPAGASVPDALVLEVGGIRLALALDRVRVVLPPGPVARVPAGAHALASVHLAGGEPIAAADLGPLLGAGTPAPPDERYVVVVDDERRGPIGILADAVVGIDELAAGAGSGLPDRGQLVRGVTADGLVVVDVDALVADPRLTTEPQVAAGHRPGAPREEGTS